MALFRDRREAGEKLGRRLASRPFAGDPVVCCIPRGGIAVGRPVADRLACPLEILTLRKLPLPGNDQMGFGAVTIDRNVILNEDLIDAGYVGRDEIPGIVEEVYAEVQRRDRLYRGGRPFPGLAGRTAIIVDDGLATGYTMRAALEMARGRHAAETVVAVPVAHDTAYELVARKADEVVCLHISHEFSFAVASFYRHFPDLNDDEVLELLAEQHSRRGA